MSGSAAATLARYDLVPVAPFRARYEELLARDPRFTSKLAVRMGWTRERGYPDAHYVRRVLGLRPHRSPTSTKIYRERVTLETAERLADAMGMAPHEWEPDA